MKNGGEFFSLKTACPLQKKVGVNHHLGKEVTAWISRTAKAIRIRPAIRL